MKHNVVFAVTNDITYDQRMHRQCTALQDAGYDVLLVGRRKRTTVTSASYPFKTRLLKCWFQAGKRFYLEYNIRLFFYLLFTKADSLCAVDLDTIMPIWAMAKIKSARFGYDAHEYFQEVPEVVDRPTVKRLWERVAAFAIPKTDFRYTVSQSIAEKFESLYGLPFGVVRNLPTYANPKSEEGNEPFLLYQGALNEGRGLELLIQVAPKLPLKVKIAGEGDLSESLRAQAKAIGAQSNVTFLGYLSPTDLAKITPKATIGYNLLENRGLSYYYSLANKFFDYTMSGIPCLVSPFPEYKKLNDQYGIGVFCELTASDIISTIGELLNDVEEYKAIKTKSLAAAKDLNWDKEKTLLIKIFDNGL